MQTDKFQAFVDNLKNALTPPLPGAPAHDILAPEHRKELMLPEPDLTKALHSSVMILFFADENRVPNVVFTKRVEYKGVHSGQVSFPGGKAEEDDSTIFDTALRETEEEIGIKRTEVMVLGELSDLYVPPSNFIIHPVVGYLNNQPRFKPDSNEVARIITVPFQFFIDERAIGTYEVTTFENLKFQVPGFMVDNSLIWGATAMILSELIFVAKHHHLL